MKSLIFLASLAASATAQEGRGFCCSAEGVKPWPGYNKVVQWETSLGDAQKRAREEHKPILFFLMVGDLDLEGC